MSAMLLISKGRTSVSVDLWNIFMLCNAFLIVNSSIFPPVDISLLVRQDAGQFPALKTDNV